MKFSVDALQSRVFDVRVDLGGLNAGVSQHFLNLAEVGATGQQVCREAVTQTVRADLVRDSGSVGIAFDQAPELDSVQCFAASGKKQFVDLAGISVC